MTLRIGWFTTARGPGSRAMFEAVRAAIEAGAMDAELAFVFCNRERGEAEATDSFFDLVAEGGTPLVTRSSVHYRREVGGKLSRPGEPLPAWRLEYDRLVDEDLAAHPFEIGMLAGYMLILEREFVDRHAVLNLHPALPTGPAGMWQAVIRQLIREGAEESGVMLHRAIAEVDEGPVVAYCRYPLRDPELESLRERLPGPPAELDDATLDGSELFAAIRARGVAREAPLVVATLAEFAAARRRVEGPLILDATGARAEPADLTSEVDAQLGRMTPPVTSPLPPPPALFVREHVAAPENRVNLALFGLLNVDAFRSWFLSRLDLPHDSVVYPPQNVAGGRPDFVAIGPNGEVRCWIEVKLGPPDTAQLKNYRATLDEPVICIAGTTGGDLVLTEIADTVRELRSGLSEQEQLSARVLLDLIDLLAGKAETWSYADPEEHLKQQPLIAALAERLPNRIIHGTPPLPPGRVLVATITQKGWTLRVYSQASTTDRSFSVMWNQAVGRGVARVPSQVRLNQYLPKGGAASNYVAWLAEAFDVDVSTLSERQSAPVSELALLERVDELADLLEALSLAG